MNEMRMHEVLREIIFQARRASAYNGNEIRFYGIILSYDNYNQLISEAGSSMPHSFEFAVTKNTFQGLKLFRSREIDSPRVVI